MSQRLSNSISPRRVMRIFSVGGVLGKDHLRLWKLIPLVAICFAIPSAGCSKKIVEQPAVAAPVEDVSGQGAPGPAPTPAVQQVMEAPEDGNVNTTLSELTHSLHRNMIGRRLNRNFDEFIAIANIKPPPPPAGKKYSISPQWRVVLVDNK